MKKAVALIMAGLMTLSMAACSSNSAGSSAATNASSKSAGTTNIVFWHAWTGSEADALQKVIDDYNKSQTEIHVETLSSQTEDKMLTALTGGSGPDVVYTADTTVSKWAQAGMLAPIDDYIKSGKIDTKNIYDSVYKLGAYDGIQYGMPYTMDSYMLFYNKDILKEVGAQPPKTLEEMAEISKKVAKKDASGNYVRLGYVPDYPWIDRIEIPYLFGADFYDFKTDKITCTTPEFKNAMNYKAEYYTDYGIPQVTKFKSGFGTYASAENPFFKGQVAFAIEGEWFETFIKQYASKDFNWGTVTVPVTASKPEIAGSGRLQAGMLSVSTKSKNTEAAFKLINYLTSDDAYIKFCASKGSLPTTYTALKSEKLTQQAPQLKPFIESVLKGKAKAFPAIPFSNEYSNEQGLAEQAIYSGEKKVDKAMEDLSAKLQSFADEWKSSR